MKIRNYEIKRKCNDPRFIVWNSWRRREVSNKDTIYRQDAIKYFAELWECIETISDREEWEDVCVTTMNEIKSAESERKKGYWIKKEPTIKELHGCYYECSKCHKFSLPFQKLNFCPNCGADMRGEQNDTD